jgi:hypothetical protein
LAKEVEKEEEEEEAGVDQLFKVISKLNISLSILLILEDLSGRE